MFKGFLVQVTPKYLHGLDGLKDSVRVRSTIYLRSYKNSVKYLLIRLFHCIDEVIALIYTNNYFYTINGTRLWSWYEHEGMKQVIFIDFRVKK